MKDKKDFFISYNHKDKNWALWINGVLEKAGYTTIIQALDFKAGNNFMVEMQEAIKNTERTIAVISQNYSKSGFCESEWVATLVQDPISKRSKLIPIRIDGSYEPEGLLATINYIDLVNMDLDKAEKRLISEIKAVVDGTRKEILDVETRHLTLREKSNLKFGQNPNFTGRTQYLEQLQTSLNQSHSTCVTQIIKGLGGIGKTQLVIEYIYTNHEQYDLIWWFEADSEQGIKQGYVDLAERLGTANQDKEMELRATLKHLEGFSTKWLLVYDNADNIEQKKLKALMPKVTDSGHIIITSRQQNWRNIGVEIPLELWGEKEGKDFLLKSTTNRNRQANDGEKAVELVTLLGGLPLAIEQAGAYIDNEGISIEKYIQKFNKSSLEECFKYGDANEKNIATTWGISFEKAKAEDESTEKLAGLCAFFAPEGIPQKVFEGVFDEDKLQKAVATLKKYSLISIDNDMLYMHRLVQQVVRENLKRKRQVEKFLKIVLNILEDKFKFASEINSKQDLELSKNLFYHVSTIIRYEACKTKFPTDTGILISNLGMYLYYKVGYYDEAINYLKQATAIFKEIGYKQGEANQLGNIGLIYRAKGEKEEALSYHKQALEIYREVGHKQGEANQLGNIGLVYYANKEEEEALNYYKQVLKIAREIGYKQGEASDLGNIGLIYRDKGENDKALSYHKQALEIHREIGYKQGEANQLVNIGLICSDKGEKEEALSYYKQALEIDREIGYKQGEANELLNIGVVYHDRGELHEALNYYNQALEIYKVCGFVNYIKLALENIQLIESQLKKRPKKTKNSLFNLFGKKHKSVE